MVSSSVVLLNCVLGVLRWQLFNDFCTKHGDRSNIAVVLGAIFIPENFQSCKCKKKEILHVILAPYELKLAKSASMTSLAYLLELE